MAERALGRSRAQWLTKNYIFTTSTSRLRHSVPGPFDNVSSTLPPDLGGDTSMETIFYQFKKEGRCFDRASKTFGRLPLGGLVERSGSQWVGHKPWPGRRKLPRGVRAWVTAAGFARFWPT